MRDAPSIGCAQQEGSERIALQIGIGYRTQTPRGFVGEIELAGAVRSAPADIVLAPSIEAELDHMAAYDLRPARLQGDGVRPPVLLVAYTKRLIATGKGNRRKTLGVRVCADI